MNEVSGDIRGLGIIAYILLNGDAPFQGQMAKTISEAKVGYISYNSLVWKKISPEALLYVKTLTRKQNTAPNNLEICLNDPWIQQLVKPHSTSYPLTIDILNQIKQFALQESFENLVQLILNHKHDSKHLNDFYRALKHNFIFKVNSEKRRSSPSQQIEEEEKQERQPPGSAKRISASQHDLAADRNARADKDLSMYQMMDFNHEAMLQNCKNDLDSHELITRTGLQLILEKFYKSKERAILELNEMKNNLEWRQEQITIHRKFLM